MTAVAALPNFIIIGAMKCATSTLHEQLARQPGVFMSEPKEPNFFSDDTVYARGENFYSGLFAQADSATLRGESSTHYTKLPTYPKTVERMKDALPKLKLIYLMRHPIERLISQYMHEWSMKVISHPLDRALREHPELIDYSLYHKQLLPFIQAYGEENVLPMFMERLNRDPQAELERVCRFLGYSETPHWQEQVAQQNASSERLRLGKLGRALFDHPLLTELRREFIPQCVRDVLKQRLTMRERPLLTAADRGMLIDRFDADLERLGRALGQPGLCSHDFKEQVVDTPLVWS